MLEGQKRRVKDNRIQGNSGQQVLQTEEGPVHALFKRPNHDLKEVIKKFKIAFRAYC